MDYHKETYGFPAADDNELLGRMIYEISQAGLSWDTILKKRDSIRVAYADFDVNAVAHFSESDILRLLDDTGIIRMRRKIEAAIHNAQVILSLQTQHGSLAQWLVDQSPMDLPDWQKLFKKTFRFMGNEITKEFLMGTGTIAGAHDPECPVLKDIVPLEPLWTR